MANPLPNEKEIYEKIEREKLSVPLPIWDLINHHIGNDLYAISLIAGTYVTGEDKEAIPPEDGKKIVKHVEEIKGFMDKISKIVSDK